MLMNLVQLRLSVGTDCVFVPSKSQSVCFQDLGSVRANTNPWSLVWTYVPLLWPIQTAHKKSR